MWIILRQTVNPWQPCQVCGMQRSFHVSTFISKAGFELWERGNQEQSHLQRNEWISLTLSSAALSAITALVLNAACKLSLNFVKGRATVFDILVYCTFLQNHSGLRSPSILHAKRWRLIFSLILMFEILVTEI